MSATLTGTKHATPKPRIVDPSEVKRGRPPIPQTMGKYTVTLDADTVHFMQQLALQETGAINLSGGIRVAARMLAQSIKPKTLYKRSD